MSDEQFDIIVVVEPSRTMLTCGPRTSRDRPFGEIDGAIVYVRKLGKASGDWRSNVAYLMMLHAQDMHIPQRRVVVYGSAPRKRKPRKRVDAEGYRQQELF